MRVLEVILCKFVLLSAVCIQEIVRSFKMFSVLLGTGTRNKDITKSLLIRLATIDDFVRSRG